MKFSKIFLLSSLLFSSFCFSNDFISQTIFNESNKPLNLDHEIYLKHQTFTVGDYHSLSNELSTNLKAQWGAVEFSQKLKSDTYSTDEFTVIHSQNQQSFGLLLVHDEAELFLGNHKQSLMFTIKDDYSFFFSQSSIKTDVTLDISGLNAKDSFIADKSTMKFDYALNASTDMSLFCSSNDHSFGCAELMLTLNNGDHKYWAGYKTVDIERSETDIESDNFQVQYDLNSTFYTSHLAYQYDQLKVGAYVSTGYASPNADILYLEAAENTLGLGRKMMHSGFDFKSTHVFISNSWQFNNHSFTSQFDYNHTGVSDQNYQKLESVLSLDPPTIKESVEYSPWNANFARAQLSYGYAFEDHTLIIDAKQLLYWSDQDQAKTQIVEPEETQVDDTIEPEETDELEKEPFKWWDGLNITFGLQWKL